MNKPESLRKALTEGVQHLRDNPETLHLFVDEGALVATLAPSISWEYRYTLNVVVTDFAGDQNLLMAPVLFWLRDNQPDMMANPDLRDKALTFEADILNNGACDLSLNLKLTERVIARQEDGVTKIEAVPEPVEPEVFWMTKRG
ncbi:phage tail protein [Erwiniaceae bacterium BAC15a-03b]|uniref:Phage tail protein n=1 Tax=Winslowiella arboricola TaxID=2978220 RepID=A0A9J6PUW6_9GAMM|nr:phage tail protein [Winslowiella arboricola]MCU5773074.1 phage tail protein [Winslowiella arboricola]MCU5777831.1 phage tail protein [Winslowiella arboricola]